MTTTVRFSPRLTTVRFPSCGSGVSTGQFAVLMQAYNDALLPFVSNDAAVLALGLGKEYKAAQGNFEAAQGTKMITY